LECKAISKSIYKKEQKEKTKDNEMEAIQYKTRPVWKYHTKMQVL
jgi:hypothetical protein